MKTYQVKFAFTQYYYATIEAEDYENALHKTKDFDSEDCEKDIYSDWEIVSINERKMPPDADAFIDAYLNAVAEAPKESIIDFLLNKPVDNEYYTSIADAYGMWCFARKYEKEQTK